LDFDPNLPIDQRAEIHSHPIGRIEVEDDLGSARNNAIVKGWLQECDESHTEFDCSGSKGLPLPTRVLDVVSQSGDDNDVRLFVTKGSFGTYAALSHCWGGNIVPVLQTSNIDQFQESISYASLAANFQDAITITRRIGIQYLWIDSLCIVQDSRDDWEIESAKMGSVYKNAAVTISAMTSKGSKEGILKRRPKMPGPATANLKIFSDPEVPESVMISWLNNEDDENLWRLNFFGHLSKRGWTLQESIMSPRILAFGQHGIYWKCPHGFQALDGQQLSGAVNVVPDKLPHLDSILYGPTADDRSPGTIDKFGLLTEYYNLVDWYSYRTLTVAADKLPAMSAIAEALSRVLGDQSTGATYLAGLWDFDLHRGLMWYPELPSAPHVLQYRAPSWSWAVTDSPIVYYNNEEPWTCSEFDLEVHHCQVQLRSAKNPFGEVISGYLQVRGYSIPLLRSSQVVYDKILSPKTIYFSHFDEPSPTGLDQVIVGVSSGERIEMMVFNSTKEKPEDWDGDLDLEINQDLWVNNGDRALLVHLEDIPGSTSNSGFWLLLRRRDGSEDMERVGCIINMNVDSSWFESWVLEDFKII